MVAYLQYWLYLAFYGVILVISAWALIDGLRRPARAFVAAGKRTKNLWLAVLGTATVVAFIALPVTPIGGGLFAFLALGSAVAAIVYLVDVRPAVASYSGRGGSSSGGW